MIVERERENENYRNKKENPETTLVISDIRMLSHGIKLFIIFKDAKEGLKHEQEQETLKHNHTGLRNDQTDP